jgi:hypothetical protein
MDIEDSQYQFYYKLIMSIYDKIYIILAIPLIIGHINLRKIDSYLKNNPIKVQFYESL